MDALTSFSIKHIFLSFIVLLALAGCEPPDDLGNAGERNAGQGIQVPNFEIDNPFGNGGPGDGSDGVCVDPFSLDDPDCAKLCDTQNPPPDECGDGGSGDGSDGVCPFPFSLDDPDCAKLCDTQNPPPDECGDGGSGDGSDGVCPFPFSLDDPDCAKLCDTQNPPPDECGDGGSGDGSDGVCPFPFSLDDPDCAKLCDTQNPPPDECGDGNGGGDGICDPTDINNDVDCTQEQRCEANAGLPQCVQLCIENPNLTFCETLCVNAFETPNATLPTHCTSYCPENGQSVPGFCEAFCPKSDGTVPGFCETFCPKSDGTVPGFCETFCPKSDGTVPGFCETFCPKSDGTVPGFCETFCPKSDGTVPGFCETFCPKSDGTVPGFCETFCPKSDGTVPGFCETFCPAGSGSGSVPGFCITYCPTEFSADMQTFCHDYCEGDPSLQFCNNGGGEQVVCTETNFDHGECATACSSNHTLDYCDEICAVELGYKFCESVCNDNPGLDFCQDLKSCLEDPTQIKCQPNGECKDSSGVVQPCVESCKNDSTQDICNIICEYTNGANYSFCEEICAKAEQDNIDIEYCNKIQDCGDNPYQDKCLDNCKEDNSLSYCGAVCSFFAGEEGTEFCGDQDDFTVQLQDPKILLFKWPNTAENSDHYRISAYKGDELFWESEVISKDKHSYQMTIPLYDQNWTNAAYTFSGCNSADICTELNTTNLGFKGKLLNGIGYFKSTATNATLDNQLFGRSVAINKKGTVMAIGADRHEFASTDKPGAVHLYERNSDGRWNLIRIIGAPQQPSTSVGVNGEFGFALSLNDAGTRLAVGMPGYNNGNGAVFVYGKDNGLWSTQACMLSAVDQLGAGARLGTSVSVGGESVPSVVAGAPMSKVGNVTRGAAAIFTVYGILDKGCSPVGGVDAVVIGRQEISSDVTLHDSASTQRNFGISVAIDETAKRVAVGVTQLGNGPNYQSYVYMYVRDVGVNTWTDQPALINPVLNEVNKRSNLKFGSSLSFNAAGSTLAIGAEGDYAVGSSVRTGAVYLSALDIARSGCTADSICNRWTGTNLVSNGTDKQMARFKPATAGDGHLFGHQVSFSGDGNRLAVSAPYDNKLVNGINIQSLGANVDTVSEAGAVYIFKRTPGDVNEPWSDTWEEFVYIKSSNVPDEGDQFGAAMELSADGQSLVVGAPFEDRLSERYSSGLDSFLEDNNDLTDSGAVYLY